MKKISVLPGIAVVIILSCTGCRSYDIKEETIKYAKDGKTPIEKTTKTNNSHGWWFFSEGMGKSFSFLNPSVIGK